MLIPPFPPHVTKRSRFCGKCLANQIVLLCAYNKLNKNIKYNTFCDKYANPSVLC